MTKTNLESKIQKISFLTNNVPKTTRIINNVIDFGSVGAVYIVVITYLTVKAIQTIPEKTYQIYNTFTNIYQTISPYLEKILGS